MAKQSKFAGVLAEAIASQGLTLERIALRLRATGHPISVATLSYWQTGRSLPTRAKSLEIVDELENILGLESGTLANALPDGAVKWNPMKVLPGESVAAQALAEMRVSLSRTWTQISVCDRITIKSNRMEAIQSMHTVRRAAVDGAKTLPLVFGQDTSHSAMPKVEAVFGCELREIKYLSEEQLVVARFELPKPVMRGTVVSTEQIVRVSGYGSGNNRIEHAAPAEVPLIVLEATFEGVPPTKVYGYYREEECEEKENQITQPVEIQRNFASYVIKDAQPGIHGLAWEW